MPAARRCGRLVATRRRRRSTVHRTVRDADGFPCRGLPFRIVRALAGRTPSACAGNAGHARPARLRPARRARRPRRAPAHQGRAPRARLARRRRRGEQPPGADLVAAQGRRQHGDRDGPGPGLPVHRSDFTYGDAQQVEAPAARRHNLPRSLTRFVGHESDFDDYAQALADNRLVTLTGVGGCGKTRLAIELAFRLLPDFPDGVWFVDLAPMAERSVCRRSSRQRWVSSNARVRRSWTLFGLRRRPPDARRARQLRAFGRCLRRSRVRTARPRGELKVLATSREALGVPRRTHLQGALAVVPARRRRP